MSILSSPTNLAGGFRACLSAALAILCLSGCRDSGPNAGGDRGIDAAGLGRSEYSRTLAEYGGPYADAELSAWVASVGQALARSCGRPDIPFSFTVLDSGLVNAFSTPGGYIYVTRGLLALANSEADVAAVLGHEMGHVIAGHQAERYTRSRNAGIASLIFGELPGWDALAELAGSGASSDLAGFSREQEYEADALGIRIMSDAGYMPGAMAGFLAELDRDAALENRVLGDAGRAAGPGMPYVEDHPLTGDRVLRARDVAAALPHPASGRVARDSYLRAIDGVLYGDKIDQGYSRGRFFVHPQAGFLFQLPAGFEIESSASAVIATRADGAAIVLTSASPGTAASPVEYLRRLWAPDVVLTEIDPISVNGRPAAIARTEAESDRGQVGIRLAAIGWSPSIVYRLIVIAPRAADPQTARDLDRVIESFRPLAPGEADRLPPRRIRVIGVKRRDTPAALARLMAFDDFPEERLRAINGLYEAEKISPGERLKIVE